MEKISGALAIGGKIPLIFDTSGLNKLLRDPDRAVLVAGLKCGYQVRLTANSISEIAAYSDSEERNRLLDLCCMFLDTGLCLHAFHIIIRRLCSRFDPAARLFDWNQTDARCRGCEDEIVRRQFIKDEISAEELSANQEHDATFKAHFDRARDVFGEKWKSSEDRPSCLSQNVARSKEDGSFWRIANGFYSRATGRDALNEEGVHKLVTECPPLHALMLAVSLTEYERGIRDLRKGPSFRADRIDLFSAVFLPYCQVFVTDDAVHHQCFVEIESVGTFGAKPILYRDFKAGFGF